MFIFFCAARAYFLRVYYEKCVIYWKIPLCALFSSEFAGDKKLKWNKITKHIKSTFCTQGGNALLGFSFLTNKRLVFPASGPKPLRHRRTQECEIVCFFKPFPFQILFARLSYGTAALLPWLFCFWKTDGDSIRLLRKTSTAMSTSTLACKKFLFHQPLPYNKIFWD